MFKSHQIVDELRAGIIIIIQRERDYYSKNLLLLNISSWLKPVLRCWNTQNTRNYAAIQIINPLIFKIVL